MPAWIEATVSVLIGGALAMFAAWLGDRRLTERERKRRQEERHERLIVQRDTFQRETLLALQVASQALLRNTGASLHLDILAYRRTGKWQRQQLPDDLSNGQLNLTTETMLLASRVRDGEVRGLAEQLREQTSAVGFASDELEAERRMMDASELQQSLIQRIGQLVRDLDEIV